ncbi:Crp/Fnr family transcriptional regulator [Paenibacillus soyae]|uniref:Crp/Fnr family transcriptional regulator n=1 Tax=Paenibacillus soyae TaxID=2969249 RepID=A0A9X2S9S8_9BACL|nr:Crp/Fnr family transcriptional regulator [Paenibacillus soyae]MCR2805789.1 Crp/Fnr family transcriptional regulator [Paenibacillus soyae]
MHPTMKEKASTLFPCLSSIPDSYWMPCEVRTVSPSTPHSIREGHMLQHAVFVLSGSVRIFKVNDQGREITLYRVQGGQNCVLMMASILGDTPYEASAEIEAETEVLLVPIPLFKQWIEVGQPLKQFIFGQMVERITSVMTLLDHIAFRPITYRVADYLLSHTDENRATLSITHEQAAIELGTAREVVSRALKALAEKRLIAQGRGYIQVLDRDRLLQVLRDEAL